MDVGWASRNSMRSRVVVRVSKRRHQLHRPTTTVQRLVRFALVGAAGTVVNTLVFAAATESGLEYLSAAFLSMEIATSFNFAMSERIVFVGHGGGRRWVRFVMFIAAATLGFLVTGPLMMTLIAVSVPPVLANLLAIGALMAVRFLVADRIIWRSGRRSELARRQDSPSPSDNKLSTERRFLPGARRPTIAMTPGYCPSVSEGD